MCWKVNHATSPSFRTRCAKFEAVRSTRRRRGRISYSHEKAGARYPSTHDSSQAEFPSVLVPLLDADFSWLFLLLATAYPFEYVQRSNVKSQLRHLNLVAQCLFRRLTVLVREVEVSIHAAMYFPLSSSTRWTWTVSCLCFIQPWDATPSGFTVCMSSKLPTNEARRSKVWVDRRNKEQVYGARARGSDF